MSNKKCLNSSINVCKECKDYTCKNLYGPIKSGSKLYKMIDLKLLDECRIDCDKCEHFNLCSSLIGENVALLGL